jgi:predicted amidohydrolase YtcJ
VLLPGLIDPHLHAYIAGLLLPMEFITPHDWSLPGKQSRSVRGHDAYLARLRRIEAAMETPDGWLDTWGFHHQFHGKLSRADLDAISSTRPILVWHRSFHEIFVNTPALTALGLTAEQVDPHPYASFERGHFQETGLELLLPRLIPRLLSRDRYQKALAHARRAIHAGGITTIADGGFSTLGFDQELQALRHAGFDSDETPFRSILLIDGRTVGGHMGHDMAREWIESLPERGGHRLRLPGKAVKLFADGGAYSQLMQMKDGYLDGHAGKWLMEPADLEAAARVYWQAGFQIHVHVNGDLGLEKTLDVLERLQAEHPREDHRFTVHHLCCATPDQARRIARLGVMVSANPYYVWALADEYAEVGLGPERASRMVPSGSVVAAGVPLAFHSDFPMAPASPMLLAWAAATRTTARGQVVAPDERISLDEALRAVTINAAYQIRMEDQIGSIEVGKLADFTVLERDPYAVPIEQLADIPIWGTVFEGRPYPLGGAE